MQIKKVLFVFGTRPEAIKMLPLYTQMLLNTDSFDVKLCVTAQHREMLDQVLSFFDVKPDFDLNIMKPGQNLYELTANIIVGMKPILETFSPDFVLVHGDTTTSMAVSLASFYSGAKIGHVEAGLRTFNKTSPFPEEMNRSLTGRMADIHFAPTETSKNNLLKEGIDPNLIFVTGNTVIDALLYSSEKTKNLNNPVITSIIEKIGVQKDLILITGHRRENFGDGFLNICKGLRKIADNMDVELIYPVHLNPNVTKPVYEILSGASNIHLIEPQPYEVFVWLMNRAKIIITDSGGVQEEAPSLGKPVLVMRNTTERPEAVDAGTVILVGTDSELIYSETVDLLSNPKRYEFMSTLHNPYGDGKASMRIINILNEYGKKD
jgi:UDP-N-acetylglucosamine 2-epimerase (non-hydrolysing)